MMPGRIADPYMDEGVRGWINNFARRSLWRVADYYELDDLIQDGWTCYYKIRNHPNYRDLTDKAEPSKDDRRHFMAMVKTAFARHVHDLSNQIRTDDCESGRACEVPVSHLCIDGESEDDVWSRLMIHGEAPESAVAILAGLPDEIVDLIDTLASDVLDAYDGFRRRAEDGVRVRETTTQRLERVKTARRDLAFIRSRVCCSGGRTRRFRRALRETTNERYCRILGLDPGEVDVRGMMHDYFSQ